MARYSERHYGESQWRLTNPRVIVLHFTATDSYSSVWNTFDANTPSIGESPGICAHFVVEQDGTIDELVSLQNRCRHTIGLNYTSIGIEMVQATGRGSHWADQQILDRRKQVGAALRLVRSLQDRYDIPNNEVIGHSMANDDRYFKDLEGWLQRSQRLAQARRQGVPRPAVTMANLPEPLAQLRLPVLAAPMSGGPGTPDLVIAAGRAGSLGFLAGGYKSPEALAKQIDAVRVTGLAFGVNLFAPNPLPIDCTDYDRYAEEIRSDLERDGAEWPPVPVENDDGWTEKLELLLADPPDLVSFTFGIPDRQAIDALKRRECVTLQTVTSADKAVAAAAAGVDVLVVQARAPADTRRPSIRGGRPASAPSPSSSRRSAPGPHFRFSRPAASVTMPTYAPRSRRAPAPSWWAPR